MRVRTKKMPPSTRVKLARTFEVCAPKRFSVIPPPKAAPRPSLFGLCMRTMKMMSSDTTTWIVSRMLIKTESMGRGIWGKRGGLSSGFERRGKAGLPLNMNFRPNLKLPGWEEGSSSN